VDPPEPTMVECLGRLPVDVVDDDLRAVCEAHDLAVAFARRVDVRAERGAAALQNAVELGDDAAAVVASGHLGALPVVCDAISAKVAAGKAAVDAALSTAIDRVLGSVSGAGKSIELGALEYDADMRIFRRYLKENEGKGISHLFCPPPTGPLDVEVSALRDDIATRCAAFDAQVAVIVSDRGVGSLFDSLGALCNMRHRLGELRDLTARTNDAIAEANAMRRGAAQQWRLLPDSTTRPL
jgi:hypothetical protein